MKECCCIIPSTPQGQMVTINGISVQLIFASERNTEVSTIVQDILKGAYLQRHSA